MYNIKKGKNDMRKYSRILAGIVAILISATATLGYAAAADSDADIKTTVAASAKESDENIKSEDNKLLKD